jgi:hypothetical protein
MAAGRDFARRFRFKSSRHGGAAMKQRVKTKTATAKTAPKARMKAKSAGSGSKVQGEGDYEAARRYRRRVKTYLENNDVKEAARRAKPRSRAEAHSLLAAESAAKRRAKGLGVGKRYRRLESPRVEPSTRGRTSRH